MVVTKKLKEESRPREEAKKAKVGLVMELTTFREQIEKAKVDTIAEFRASQPFIDANVVYYDNSFEACLQQVGSIYLDLDLSKVSLDDLLPTTPAGCDTVDQESDDSAHTEKQIPKDDRVVIALPVPEGHLATLVPSVKDLFA